MKAEACFIFEILSAVPVGFQQSNFLQPVLPSTYSSQVELGSASGPAPGVFQSKDGVMSEIDGWFRRSFVSAVVRAAIGSAGSGAAMAGCNQTRVS